MIEQILQPFDFILQMPIDKQCEFSVGLSFAGFCIAALLRESCKDHHIRYAARALGAAAFFAVAAFAVHATQQVEQLEQELFVKAGKKISTEHVVTLTSRSGNTIQIGDDNGLRGTGTELRQHDGSLRRSGGVSAIGRSRFAAGSVGGSGGGQCGDDGRVAVARVPEWIRNAYGAAGHSAIQHSGEVKGKDF